MEILRARLTHAVIVAVMFFVTDRVLAAHAPELIWWNRTLALLFLAGSAFTISTEIAFQIRRGNLRFDLRKMILRLSLSRNDYEATLNDLEDAFQRDLADFPRWFCHLRRWLSVIKIALDNLPIIKAIKGLLDRWTGA